MIDFDRKSIQLNEEIINRIIKEGKVIVFTLNKSLGTKEIISWNTRKKYYPLEMSDESIRIGYLLNNIKEIGLDDLAMPDQPLAEKLIEECHELTAEEIMLYYETEIAKKQGTIWNVNKNYDALFMTKETYDEVFKTIGRKVSLVYPCADCAVARFYDSEHQIIGITHSDAVRTGRKIIPKCITYMQEKFGTNISKLQVFIGAFAFEGWTYDRIPSFAIQKNENGEIIGINSEWSKYIIKDNDRFLINYGDKIFDQIVDSGIRKENISMSPNNTLTNDKYFSNSRSFNSRVDGVATYREGRNLIGISFSNEKLIKLMKKQNVTIR